MLGVEGLEDQVSVGAEAVVTQELEALAGLVGGGVEEELILSFIVSDQVWGLGTQR